MKSNLEMKYLYFWAISVLKKNQSIFFCNLTAKVLKLIMIIDLVLNLMLYYSTYIHLVVFTFKTCQNIFDFCLKI